MVKKSKAKNKALPDVAKENSLIATGVLDAVGMSGVEVPITVVDAKGKTLQIPARVEAFVNLNKPKVRGIHMSRLFHEVQSGLTSKPLGLKLLAEITGEFLKSHEDLSDRAEISVNFEAMLQRPTLKSENTGWRSYPVKLSVKRQQGQLPEYFIEVMVVYSSTCPASAALSRQLIQENFQQHFKSVLVKNEQVYSWLGRSEGINATPHAQRSYAQVKIQLKKPEFAFSKLIDLIEESLQTPVQSMVKREDEQEFALRNGQNLMFCEDAARRVKRDLELLSEVIDYSGEFRHVESLHAHDAVAMISKGK